MTASLPWLRLYDEVLDDPKVQRLTDAQFRAWINLLCLANRGTIRGRIPENLDDIAYSLRLTPRKTREVLDLFLSRGLLVREENTNHVMPNNWEERQRKSDSGAERVAKHRAQKAESNVTEPLHETPVKRSREDTEKRREEKKTPPSEGDAPAQKSNVHLLVLDEKPTPQPTLVRATAPKDAQPRPAPKPVPKKTKLPADWDQQQKWGPLYEWAKKELGMSEQAVDYETDKFMDHWQGNGELKENWMAAWRNWMRRSQEGFAARSRR